MTRMDVNRNVWMASDSYGCEQKCMDGKWLVWIRTEMHGWQLAGMDVNRNVWMASGSYGCEEKCMSGKWRVWM